MNEKINPHAIILLNAKKLEQKRMIETSELEKELLKYNICPKCASDLTWEIKKWYKMFSHDIIKTCPKCGIVEKRNFHRNIRPFGIR